MKKIIFFFSQQIEKFNYERLNFENFKKNGFIPVYVDVSQIFIKKKNYKLKFKIDKINYKSISSCTDLFIYVLSIIKDKPYFIDFTYYKNFFFLITLNILSFFGAKKIHISASIVNNHHLLTSFEKLKLHINNFEMLKILSSAFNFFKNKFFLFLNPKADFVFISGLEELKKFKNYKFCFYSSSLDYNKFCNIKEKIKKKTKKNFVYLDQNLLFHKDFTNTNESKFNKKNFFDFYNKLNDFFCKISEKYNCKIIFCLHPRSTKNDALFLKKFFKKKFIFFSYKTELEIQKSDLVIFNYSNSHQLGVLFEKPMIIVHDLTNKYYDYELKKKIIRTISDDLDIKVFNLNNNTQKMLITKKYNKKKYKNYISKYISACYPRKIQSWEVVINTIKALNDFKK